MKDTNKIDLKKAGKDFAKRFTGVISRLADEDIKAMCLECRAVFEEWISDSRTCPDCEGGMAFFDLLDTNTLREEQNLFKQWLNSGATNFPEDGYDWWINKFNQKLEEIEREIEKCSDFADSGDTLKQRILQIIKNKKI